MIEELLRESFASHEALAPAPEPVRARIEAAVRRRRQRRRMVGGTAVALVALALMAAGTLIRVDGLRQPIGVGVMPATGRAITLMLVGTDLRPGSNDIGRADAIVLAHLPADRGAAYLISIPRDVRGAYQGRQEKFSDIFALGGISALVSAVTQRTGIAVDGAARIEFSGLVAIVDAVGGVDMCVDRRVHSEHTGFGTDGRFLSPADGGKPVEYPAGCRHFTGAEALDYLRIRRSLPDGDNGRQRHNRQFLEAFYAKLADADLHRLMSLVRAAGNGLTVDFGVYTMTELFLATRGITPEDLVGVEPPATLDGLLPEAESLWAAVTQATLPAWVAANPGQVS